MGLKWKSDICIFVLPGPSLMRPFTCNSMHYAEPAAQLTYILALLACNAIKATCTLYQSSCQQIVPSR